MTHRRLRVDASPAIFHTDEGAIVTRVISWLNGQRICPALQVRLSSFMCSPRTSKKGFDMLLHGRKPLLKPTLNGSSWGTCLKGFKCSESHGRGGVYRHDGLVRCRRVCEPRVSALDKARLPLVVCGLALVPDPPSYIPPVLMLEPAS